MLDGALAWKPLDFNLGLRYSYEQGRPYGPLFIARGFNQGSVTILSQPRGAFTLPATGTYYVRLFNALYTLVATSTTVTVP